MTVSIDQLPAGVTLRDVVLACGGWAETGRLCGVTPQSVIKWKRVPDRHVNAIVRASGLPLSVIRPDLFAARERLNKAKKRAARSATTTGRKK